MQEKKCDFQRSIFSEQSSDLFPDLLPGKWYLKSVIIYSSDLYPMVEHLCDNIWVFHPRDNTILVNYCYDPFSVICYYLHKTTLYMYHFEYDSVWDLNLHYLEAYHIDNLTTEQMRLRLLLSSGDTFSADQKYLIFTRQKPCNETPQCKWVWQRRQRNTIPLLERARDLTMPVSEWLLDYWGLRQTEPDADE